MQSKPQNPTPEQLKKLPKWAVTHVEELNFKLALSRALTWPLYPAPKPIEIHPKMPLTKGWFFHSHGDVYDITLGCTEYIYHCRHNPNKTSTQGSGRCYYKRLEALQACRIQVTERFAKVLAQIDMEIENELKEAQ